MNSHSDILSFPGIGTTAKQRVYFNRVELNAILNIYGRMVSAGIWKDYAIEEGGDHIGFCVYKRASDVPDFRIIKEPRLAKKQGAFAITGRGGSIVKRGQTLENVLGHFRKKLMRLVD